MPPAFHVDNMLHSVCADCPQYVGVYLVYCVVMNLPVPNMCSVTQLQSPNSLLII